MNNTEEELSTGFVLGGKQYSAHLPEFGMPILHSTKAGRAVSVQKKQAGRKLRGARRWHFSKNLMTASA